MTIKTFFTCLFAAFAASAAAQTNHAQAPAKIIFDTDIGNDVDDVMALSMLHALQSRGDCTLLAVTVTKPDELAGPFVNAMNTFYGRPEIPIGYTQAGLKNEPSRFLSLVDAADNGQPRYPHSLKRSSDAPPATTLLREILGRQSDDSVVMVQVGFFSNFAALLDTAGDTNSPLNGRELVKRKVRFLSVMAGSFHAIGTDGHYLEYNILNDIPAAQKLVKGWPTPIVWSGFEVGIALPFPATSIEHDFGYVRHHLAAEAYCLYNPPPHNRPTWDLTSTLYAVFPDRDYFTLSTPGTVTISNDGCTRFDPDAKGRDRFLIVTGMQVARVKEAFVQLVSEPPACLRK